MVAVLVIGFVVGFFAAFAVLVVVSASFDRLVVTAGAFAAGFFAANFAAAIAVGAVSHSAAYAAANGVTVAAVMLCLIAAAANKWRM